MDKIRQFLNRNGMVILVVLGLLIYLNGCRSNSLAKQNQKQITLLKDSLSVMENKIKKDVEIEGLKTSKRILYDWNAVIRTTVRPDDRMNEYDREIEKLQKTK